jgi:hypothetical protein
MTITGPDARSGAPGQAVVDAAMLVLERMGLTPADLLTAPAARPPAPTFAEYIPVVSALVSDGCRRAYGSYWNRVVEQWGDRRIDEPTPSEIRQLVQHVRANVVPRRNSRGGRSAAEHLIAALRCLYKHAEEDGLIDPADNPARKVDKPRRLPSTRRAVADKRLAEINHAAATTGDDPELDTLLLRLHTETACFSWGQFGLTGWCPDFARSAAGHLRAVVQRVLCTMSAVAHGLVELGHELPVGRACGGEVLVSFLELEAQVDDLLLKLAVLLGEVAGAGGRHRSLHRRVGGHGVPVPNSTPSVSGR